MLDGQVFEFEGERRAPVVRLAVVEMDGAWRLIMDGQRVGRFRAEREALACAQDMAREMRSVDLEVEVLAQDRFGEIALAEELTSRSIRNGERLS